MTFVRAAWEVPQSVYSVLIEPPTEEPITLEEAKLRAGLTWADGDPRDALMGDHIKAARAKVELDTGLALLTQTRDVYFSLDPMLFTGIVPLPGQCSPVQSIQDVTPAASSSATPWRPDRAFGMAGRSVEAATPTGVYRIVAGWPTAADLRAHAPLLFQAVGLLTAHYATVGRDLAIPGAIARTPAGYDEAIAPYALVWVT
jgi:uncharacterized phiE125 gp8 family phage protein